MDNVRAFHFIIIWFCYIALGVFITICSAISYALINKVCWRNATTTPVLEARAAANLESGNPEVESLPSYTIVSGLPSYEEALEQLKKVKDLTKDGVKTNSTPIAHAPTQIGPQRLSVTELFQLYKSPTLPATSDVKT